MFGMVKTLIVVYKDEMIVNQLKKMIETKDDVSDEEVIGTRDGSINIVAWNEKVWLGNKKAGNIKDKVLFLGDIKGTDKLTPVLDVKFNEYGVKFGCAGNQAVLYVDNSIATNREKYIEFISKLSELPIPEMIKEAKNIKYSEQGDELLESTESKAEGVEIVDEKKKAPVFLMKAKDMIATSADAAVKAGNRLAVKAEDTLRDRSAVTRQQLFYGVIKMYNDCLEYFMNM